jgi:CheY-like chemotaxis protein
MSKHNEMRKPVVLIVEDEPLVSEMAAEALADQGFEIVSATRAEDALDHLRSGAPVDVLFTDINLAGAMDGSALALIARQLHPKLPVVYTSGLATPGQMRAVNDATFVPKPYDPFEVAFMIESIVGGCRRRAQRAAAIA